MGVPGVQSDSALDGEGPACPSGDDVFLISGFAFGAAEDALCHLSSVTWRRRGRRRAQLRNALRACVEGGTLGRVSESGLGEYARLLGDVAEIDNVWVDPETAPRVDSLAAVELRAAQEEPGREGTWGERWVRDAYMLAGMKYEVALDHARAMAGLMTARVTAGVMTGRQPSVSVPVSVLARALVEVAAYAWWLLEPEIGHVSRVRRLQLLRYRSAVEGERAAEADGVAEEELRDYTETKAQVGGDSRALALEVPGWSKKVRRYVCGGEELPTVACLVKQMFAAVDLPSAYRVLSGYAHGELFVLWREFVRAADDSARCRPVVNEESFRGAVAVASYALHPPAYRMMRLYGFG